MPTIIKRGGARTEYTRDKLRASMTLALRKRRVRRWTRRWAALSSV